MQIINNSVPTTFDFEVGRVYIRNDNWTDPYICVNIENASEGRTHLMLIGLRSGVRFGKYAPTPKGWTEVKASLHLTNK